MTDNVARLILLVGFAVVMPAAVYHRVKSRTDEKLDRRQEGWLILLTLRPLGLAFMAGMIAFVIRPSWMAWAAIRLPAWPRWIGVGLGVGAGALIIWTLHSLGHNLTDTVVTRRNSTLVTHGPYRFVRHPMNVVFPVVSIVLFLMSANWVIGVAMLILIGTLTIVRAPIEEEQLIERFGEDYRTYMRRTGRFFPRLTRRKRRSD